MQIIETALAGCKILKNTRFADARGFFQEIYVQEHFIQAGIAANFVQDNLSTSHRGVIRGMHFQQGKPQAKLVTVISGEIFDVMVDIRPSSATFGKWQSVSLSAEQGDMLWIPEGFAHGFQALSDNAVVFYKTTAQYDPSAERCFQALDKNLQIRWPLAAAIMSAKDQNAPSFNSIAATL